MKICKNSKMVRISLSWRKSRSRQQLFCTMTSRTSFVGVLLTFVAIVMMVENVECHQDIPNINNKRIWRGQTTTVPKISSSSKIITNVSNLKNMIGRLRGGGASPSSTPGIIARLAPPVISKKPSDSSSSFRIPGYQQNQQQYTDQQQQQMIDDRQESKEMMDSFLTRDSRNSFIARVYAILSCQLLVTAGCILLFGLYPELSLWMKTPGSIGVAVPIVSLLLSTIAFVIISISPNARRVSPLKWQLLTLFTIGEALSVSFISSFYTFRSVLVALLATTAATTSISVYTATQTNPKYDLSQWGSMLSSFGLIFFVYGIIQVLQLIGIIPAGFVPYSDMLYGCVGATLFAGYLAYHTKLIVAGKHSKYQMNDKDYVFGAMTLYNDIINLFIYLLRILGDDKEKH